MRTPTAVLLIALALLVLACSLAAPPVVDTPTAGVTPVRVTETPTPGPSPFVTCTPPACQPGESYACVTACPGGCGVTCATPTSTYPQIMCTPPYCQPNEVYHCPDNCPGGCGTTCATMTPTYPSPMCTPPPCEPREVYYCPSGDCPRGCGLACATLTPSPTPPVILYFRAFPPVADPGATITLEWQAAGGSKAALYHLLGGQLSTWWDVQLQGSMAYTIPVTSRNSESFALFVSREDGQLAQATLTVPLTCPDVWFFTPAPNECPSGPALVGDGAVEHFERGVMLWSRAEDRIYVLYIGRNPAWDWYEDMWNEGDPETDPTLIPPPGLYQPKRGFGLVWREEPGVRDALGWATDQEQGYTISIQSTARYKYNVTYISSQFVWVYELGPERSWWSPAPTPAPGSE